MSRWTTARSPTDFDGYVDYPAKTDKDIAARFYVKMERDPERVARLDERQNAAIMELLRWTAQRSAPSSGPEKAT
jgi:hypothetical protein